MSDVIGQTPENMLLSLRTYLIIRAIEDGVTFYEAASAVNEILNGTKTISPVLRTYEDWGNTLRRDK